MPQVILILKAMYNKHCYSWTVSAWSVRQDNAILYLVIFVVIQGPLKFITSSLKTTLFAFPNNFLPVQKMFSVLSESKRSIPSAQ